MTVIDMITSTANLILSFSEFLHILLAKFKISLCNFVKVQRDIFLFLLLNASLVNEVTE